MQMNLKRSLFNYIIYGITSTEIFKKCEIPPEIIGQKRIDTFSFRVKQKIKDGKLLEDD